MSTSNNNRLQLLRKRCESRHEFAQQLRWHAQKDLTFHEMRRAIEILRSFTESVRPLRIAVLGSYTTELLRDYWIFHALLHDFEIDLHFTPYGQIIQELHRDSEFSIHKPDFTYLLLQWSDIAPMLAEPLHSLGEQEHEKIIQLAESALSELITAAKEATAGTIVFNFLPSFILNGLGLYDVMSESCESFFRSRLKRSISALLRDKFPSVYFDDGDYLIETLGTEGLFDLRLWYAGRFPFTAKGANLLVQRLFRFPVLSRTPKLKCIVLDCDNTLWGGIIGEDGMTGIDLGPDYPGSCYVAFQRRLLDFLHRGCLLAICSKNNLADVREVLREHPHMVLRENNFAAIRANWDHKPDNLRSIADELRLGLDSFLIVDDSPHECRMVRTFLPEVRVVRVPRKPLDIPGCLEHLQELEVLSFTAEDRNRFKMYVHNRQRRELAVVCRDVNEYLKSLKMKMQIGLNGADNLARLAQMTQKTNQFNLTTKRYCETDIQSFTANGNWLVAYFSLSDIFGDNGIVGLMMIRDILTRKANIDTFLLSCRVIGRKAEEAFLYHVLKRLNETDTKIVTASYKPTQKNILVKDFWSQQGFKEIGKNTYEFNLGNLPEQHPSLAYFQIKFVRETL